MDTTRDVAGLATRNNGLAAKAACVLGVAALLAGGAVGAWDGVASTPDGRPTVQVRVGDLDGRHDAGAAAMYSRLKRAADRVCGPRSRELELDRLALECRATALRDAVARANVPKLSALHAARTGERDVAAPGVNAVRGAD
jgi:UrcA family protein